MGTLYLVSTPIGNLGDISQRAIETLFKIDYILCEDTRRTGNLLKQLETKLSNPKHPKLISFYEEVENQKTAEVLNYLQNDFSVALISDAGTPLISDPGYKLVSVCLRKNIQVISIPGSTAFVTALISSGLPSNSFWFLGFSPQKTLKRQSYFKSLLSTLNKLPKSISMPTLIFYESPHRLIEVIKDLGEVFGNREVVLARELTKIYETIEKKMVNKWLEYFTKIKPQGEYVILFNLKS